MKILEGQSPTTLARLKAFGEVYFADGDTQKQKNISRWIMAGIEARLTFHDRELLTELEEAELLSDLLTIDVFESALDS